MHYAIDSGAQHTQHYPRRGSLRLIFHMLSQPQKNRHVCGGAVWFPLQLECSAPMKRTDAHGGICVYIINTQVAYTVYILFASVRSRQYIRRQFIVRGFLSTQAGTTVEKSFGWRVCWRVLCVWEPHACATHIKCFADLRTKVMRPRT